MNKELSIPLVRAIAALVLVVLVKITATVTLSDAGAVYSAVELALSLAVVVILLRFRLEFNRQLGSSYPNLPESQSLTTGIVLLVVVLTLYWAFTPYSGYLPGGIYSVVFFILALIPVYSIWNILNKNTDRLSELLTFTAHDVKFSCSCGWENPASAKFCSRCGSPVKGKIA